MTPMSIDHSNTTSTKSNHQTQTLQIQIPQDAEPGDTLCITVDGCELELLLPVHSKPGDFLQIQIGNNHEVDSSQVISTKQLSDEMEEDEQDVCTVNGQDDDSAVDDDNDDEEDDDSIIPVTLGSYVGGTLYIQSKINKDRQSIHQNQKTFDSSQEDNDEAEDQKDVTTDGTHAMVWPAGVHLAQFLTSSSVVHQLLLKTKNAIELGSGLGTGGIALCASLAKNRPWPRDESSYNDVVNVVFSDRLPVLPFMEQNIRLNQKYFGVSIAAGGGSSSTCSTGVPRIQTHVIPLVWGDHDMTKLSPIPLPCDLVIGSDLLYDVSTENYKALCDTICTLIQPEVKPSQDRKIILSTRWRKPDKERIFFQEMEKRGVEFHLAGTLDTHSRRHQLDWREFGNNASEKSNNFFRTTLVRVKGRNVALEDLQEEDIQLFNDDEYCDFEDLFIQIYIGFSL